MPSHHWSSNHPGREVKQPIRVILIEDEGLFRDMLRGALARTEGIEVVGDFADGQAALEQGPALAADVAILDIELGSGSNGIQVGRLLRQRQPDLGIVLLSNHDQLALLSAVPEQERFGWSYLLKKSVADVASLVRAVEGAAAGFVVLDPHLARAQRAPQDGPLAALTPRQFEILTLMAQGFNNAAISGRLGLARKTVENQINLIYQLLDVDTVNPDLQPRVQAVLAYLRASHLL